MPPLLFALLAATPDVNLLSTEAGTMLVETPSNYGGHWGAESLTDENPAVGWCSAAEAKGPFRFTYELEQRSALAGVEVSNAAAEEGIYPGISASGLEVWVSSTGPDAGFTRVATVPLKRAGGGSAGFPKGTLGRWVRLVVPGNLGHPRYTELFEVAVRGHPLEPSPRRGFGGQWTVEGGLLALRDDDGEVTGCAVWPTQVWTLRGTVAGRVAKLGWTSAEDATGTMTLAIGDDGRVSGTSSETSRWLGTPRPAEAPPLDCHAALMDLRLARRLEMERLGITLQGVSFDPATDELKADPKGELPSLERVLAAGRGVRARVLVLGRTSEPAPDELKRCERRAQSLLRHLTQAGVGASTLDLGVGLVKVGAAVQLEPRVEIVLLGP